MNLFGLALALGMLDAPALDDPSPRPATPFSLKGGERVVFFGDSITQSGAYVTDVEAYLLTRFPDRTFTILNHGISSETISGTSEPDHDPRRPDAHDRFDRDVTAWKPDVVVACFGMNDGNYFPFEPERFARYQAGVERLRTRVRDEAHARLTLMTPPPFDPYRRSAGDPKAKQYGYRFAALDYDQTLERYSEWLVGLRSPELPVADLHTRLNEILRQRRQDEVSFFLAGDGVHPGPTGHLLMAQTLLETWGAPALVSEAAIDAASGKVRSGDIASIERGTDGSLQFTWRTPLPAPFDPACDAQCLELAGTAERLNRHRLQVEGLPPGNYRLLARPAGSESWEPVRVLTDVELARGLDLTALAQFPTVRQSQALRERLLKRNQTRYDAWRKSLGANPTRPDESADATATEAIQALARPMTLEVRLEPVPAL